MHKFIQTICLFVLLTFALNTQAQIINIPDANFKAKLLEASTINLIAFDSSNNPIKIDTNNDGDIQIVEANKVHQLAVDNSNISTLEGIQYFKNITHLKCSYNKITTLNVKELIKIKQLFCNNNLLEFLVVDSLPNLTHLYGK